jgi:predicted CXXCH cytochrome family protein
MRIAAASLACLSLLLLATSASGADEKRLAPLPKDQAVVVHGPYEQGACDTCHERADAKDPGKAKVSNETCLGCHDEFAGSAPVRISKSKSHPTSKSACTTCHNPHNSKKKKLLL